MGDTEDELPKAQPSEFGSGLTLLPPLSRRGKGPGLIVLVPEIEGFSEHKGISVRDGVPSTLMKWAEEGYVVVQVEDKALMNSKQALSQAMDELRKCESCEPKEVAGLVSYSPKSWELVAPILGTFSEIKAAVVYADVADESTISPTSTPVVHHLAGKAASKLDRSEKLSRYDYPGEKSFLFATPFHSHFHYSAEAVSHTRSLTHLKKQMNAPIFDLESIWDEHTYWEFENRSVEKTMATMVQEPYVNHVPTMTGGIGRDRLTNFYRHHFIFSNPPDTGLELISRTVGIDRVVDEFIFSFTHTSEIEWLIPGIPPTGKHVQIPFTAIVNIRGDRLYHEHIAWDQASCLIQLGLLPEYLPYPHALPDGRTASAGKKFEFRVPAAGVSTSNKLRDKNSVESNELFQCKIREVDA